MNNRNLRGRFVIPVFLWFNVFDVIGNGRSRCVYSGLVRSMSLALAAAGMLACESTSAPVPAYEHHVTAEMVTGAALAALRSDGRFNLEAPVTGAGQVSLPDAKSQTLQFARYVTNNVLLRGAVEAGRGGYWTDPHLLTICGDSYFVHSQVGVIAVDTISENAGQWLLRHFAPQWIVPMCGSQNDPQMTVQVAIEGNDIRFADGVPIEPYFSLSTAWFARGVPLNWPDALTLSAERAVRFAWETFGVRATEVPQLYARGDIPSTGTASLPQIGSARFCNRWRVVLENDVAVRSLTTFTQSTTRVIWVAPLSCHHLDVEPRLHLPLPEQPTVANLEYFDNSVNPAKTWMVLVPVKAPVRFELGTRAL